MADLKISALPAATTPLAGTETLPIVQSGATKKVSVADLTAGRAVSASDLSYTGTLTGSTGVLNIGSGQVYKDATGKVGIGTTSPSANLSVGDDSTATSRQITLHGPASGTNSGASMNIRNATDTILAIGNASNIVGGSYSANAMIFWTTPTLRLYGNGAERASIDASGNTTLSTGNLVIGTSGKGIDFSATPGTGTSELLADYEEGTFTPTDNSGAGLTFTQTGQATYVKSGTQVTCTMDITFPVTADTSFASIAFPFATATSSSFVGQIGYQSVGVYLSPAGDGAGFNLWNIAGSPQTNATLSAKRLQISFTYRSAA